MIHIGDAVAENYTIRDNAFWYNIAEVLLRAENLHALTFDGRKWYNVGS